MGTSRKEGIMGDDRSGLLGRRHFLTACGVLAVGGCFSGLNVRDALAASQQMGKPVLTDAQFNTRLTSLQRGPGYRAEIEDLKHDLLVYLEARYNLTPQQRTVVSRLPQAQRAALNANLDQALQRNLGVKLQIRTVTRCQTLKLTFAFTNLDMVITALA